MPVASTGTDTASPRPKPAKSRNISSNEESFMDSLFGGIGAGGDGMPNAVTRQMIFGGVSGWVTGFLAMKVGKAIAIAVGGGIIILQIANHQGYININWNRLQRDADKFANKITEGDKKQGWTNKLETKLDQLSDRAENLLDTAESRTKRWYNKLLGRESRDLHAFLATFAVGTVIGVITGGVMYDWDFGTHG